MRWKQGLSGGILIQRSETLAPSRRVLQGGSARAAQRRLDPRRNDALTTDEGTAQTNPYVAKAAPRLALVVHAGKEEERKIECRRVVTLLGSREGCKLALQHDSVAPLHVAIVNDGSKLLAIDLVTKHGTLLNGLKMEQEQLNDGDMLTIHPWEFRIDITEPTHSGQADAHPFGLEPSPHVVALEHVGSGRVMQSGRNVCIIGRRNGCDIILSDKQVSRVHALLFSYFDRPALFNLFASNQTFVNGQPVQFRLLKDGDAITVGESDFRVRLVGSPATEGAAGLRGDADATVGLKPEEREGDMIDIHATEATQHWRIADNLQKATRKR